MCRAGGFHTFSMFVLGLCMCETNRLGTLKSNNVTGMINIPKKLCVACVKLLFNLLKNFFFCVFFLTFSLRSCHWIIKSLLTWLKTTVKIDQSQGLPGAGLLE